MAKEGYYGVCDFLTRVKDEVRKPVEARLVAMFMDPLIGQLAAISTSAYWSDPPLAGPFRTAEHKDRWQACVYNAMPCLQKRLPSRNLLPPPWSVLL